MRSATAMKSTSSLRRSWTADRGRRGRAVAPAPEVPSLTLANGLGGFAHGGREYVVVLDGDQETPMPWANVLANPGFGTIVTASGASFTWAENSREHRL